MELRWHKYRYYPYERELALREVHALLAPASVKEAGFGIRLDGSFNAADLERLVYFSEGVDGARTIRTLQSKLERSNGNGTGRQSTRYSAHGLHEYKGKFNPQIARAVLNVLRVPRGARVLDPFCGSGTSLVECAHLGVEAVGTDINPLAVMIANAKLQALELSNDLLHDRLTAVIRRYRLSKPPSAKMEPRRGYLESWFEPEILDQIEKLRAAIEHSAPDCPAVFLAIASNLLRDYSLQDPCDLRIRRRKSPLPETPLIEAFEEAANSFLLRAGQAKTTLGPTPLSAKALLLDCRSAKPGRGSLGAKFDCALTSPPYATALPYIDTQRLSLVWLGLLAPDEITRLEARLVGSRELRGESRGELASMLNDNSNSLPEEQLAYIRLLQDALSPEDGFRRQALPILLYRYFSGMADAFTATRGCMKDGAPFALIVGRNHTTLGGKRFDIDTPRHLTNIASFCGWSHEETIPLQTYQRYGYHMSNAVSSEDLIILRAL